MLPESEWVNDKSYPSTFRDYLKVIDSYLGGLSGYEYVPESRLCVRFLADNNQQINDTIKVWNFTEPKTYKIYYETSAEIIIYNAT